MTRLIDSPGYQQLWGDRFKMVKRGERRIENNQTGYKVATSVGGLSTGERGDRVILDDPHNVIKAESDLEREKTVRFVRESMSNRINDERSAIVIIMQRLHEGDVSGDILAREANYCHLMVPMYFDPLRYPASADGEATEDPETGEPYEGNEIGWMIHGPQTKTARCSRRGSWPSISTRRVLVIIVQRDDDVPTTGTRKECHSRHTNSVCATKAEDLTSRYRDPQQS